MIKIYSISIFAAMSMFLSCHGASTPMTGTIEQDSIFPIGAKVNGYFDTENNYFVVEEAGYESSSVSETSPYTSLDRVDSMRNILGVGLINKDGVVVVAPKYSGLSTGFNDYGICKVSDFDGKWGFVNLNGFELKPQYDDIWDELQEGKLLKVSKNELQGYINLDGEVVIPLEYLSLGDISEGLIDFCNEPQKWGYINTENKVIIQPQFTNAYPFKGDKVVLQKEGGDEYTVYKDGRIVKN